MDPQTTADSGVQKPKYSNWGFKAPKPELVKIVIDLRSKASQATYDLPPERHGPSLSSVLSEYQRNLQTGSKQVSNTYVPELFRKENQPPGSSQHKEFHLFGNESVEGTRDKYFGGPIFDKTALKWRQTHYTRACGDVIGAAESDIPLPSNMSQVVKSIAVMSSKHMTQTAIWIGPRLLLSTLHLHEWIQGYPSNEECELLRKTGQTFDVESEICSKVLSIFSPKVQLLQFSAKDDIGIFKLQDHYPSILDYVNPGWLLDRGEVYEKDLKAGQRVACVGYSSKISEEDALRVKDEAAIQLQRIVSLTALSAELIDLDMVTKPSMKSFAPGTLDFAKVQDESTRFGVSASLWKGSSGGPCILLDGAEGGAIIGLVRGYELLSDPYNIVNGFPAGLKAAIKGL